MDTLSTDSFILGQIGALELGGGWESQHDDVLETAARANIGPTSMNCTLTGTHCIDDGALEAAGADMALGPTQVNCGRNPTIVIRCVSDGALESAAANAASGATNTCGPNLPPTALCR